MMRTALAVLVTCAATGAAWGGGSNYGIAPGSRPAFAGKATEYGLPAPFGPQDMVPGADGNIYVAETGAGRVARFDPRTRQFKEWVLPPNSKPHGLLLDRQGMLWYAGNGNATIGKLNTATGQVTEYRLKPGGDPMALATDGRDRLWFTMTKSNRIGRLDMLSGMVTEYDAPGNPLGIAIDRVGNVWFSQSTSDALGKLNSISGQVESFPLEPGAQPRRMAAGPDGMLWVALAGKGKLLKFEPFSGSVFRDFVLPAGPTTQPYTVTVDGLGGVWVNDGGGVGTVVRLDGMSGAPRSVQLPFPNPGVRKLAVDAEGRVWYLGSQTGKLGVID